MILNLKIKQFFLHIAISIVFTAFFFLPDLIFDLFNKEYLILNNNIFGELIVFVFINFILLSIPNIVIKYFFYILFVFFALVQQLHYSFFHSLIMPYEISLFIDQPEEVFESLFGIYQYILVTVGAFILIALSIYYLLKKSNPFVLKIKKIPVLLIGIFLFAGSVVSYHSRIPTQFYPNHYSSSIKNLYSSISWWAGKGIKSVLKNNHKNKQFKQYVVEDANLTSPRTIIVVMGESLNAKYMSLYGFSKQTTPKLCNRKHELIYTWGYSGGVETKVSVPTFFTLKREPENVKLIFENNINLFKFAKKSGYETYYVTTQKLTILQDYLADSVDHVISLSDSKKTGPIYDEVLVDYLKRIDFSKKNFIVLHQRNSHSPYMDYTPKEFQQFKFQNKDYKEYMQNTYFNSILYSDSLYDDIINIAKKQNESAVVFFTSDHGEMIGNDDENNRYGHAFLGLEDTKVPMMIYLNNKASKSGLRDALNLNNIISHYQFGKLIAKSIGINVVNSNENGEYYINGIDITGDKGFIKYGKKGEL